VYVAGTGFGPDGPYVDRPGQDLLIQSMTGLAAYGGRRGDPPTPSGSSIVDASTALLLAFSAMVGLFHRERTGRGQRIETSLVGGQIWAQASEITGYLLTGEISGRANRGNRLIPGLYAIFKTADGWIAIVGVVGPARQLFFETIGRPDLNDRFPQPLYWDEEKAELFPILDEVFSTRPTAEWCAVLRAAGLRFAPVRDHAEVVADPSVWTNGYLAVVEGNDGETKVVAPPVRFSATPAAPAADPPELGQHTEEVLLEIGYSWDDIGRFRDGGVI